ncbi:gamma-secretase subunit Aph-1-like [Paramacrobiotus metropolitanus]|uniref:gamma-secretase subunit Aph-1-like n=1 Tax=Paramacrobiotus metropolitanus TaxID=2943436 RepID=UPI0024456292|nr:gamma-secretase subunit Aph-1-like [Paramacrobiotus metropolitanus]
MTLMTFFGCAITAFGPALSFFVIIIARDPIRVIIVIASGFYWLLSLLLSSGLWMAVVPLRNQLAFGLVFSVLLQELFRFAFYKTMRKAEKGLQMVSDDEMYKDHNVAQARLVLALVSGFGYGLISGAFALINVLADIWGPGTLGLLGRGDHYFFFTSAYLTMCIIFLHTCWSVIFFYACDKRKYHLILMVVVSHMLISCLTLINAQKLYAASLVPVTLIMLAVAVTAFFLAGGSLRNWRSLFKRSASRSLTAGTVNGDGNARTTVIT